MQVAAYPALVERFHNHGGVQLKCYCIAGQVYVHVKPSFPDVALARGGDGSTCLIAGATTKCLPSFVYAFHSLENMPKAASGSDAGRFTYDQAVIDRVAQCIQSKVGLTVFGFDLIKPKADSVVTYLLIDVNAFPSFKGVPEAASALRKYLKQLVAQRK